MADEQYASADYIRNYADSLLAAQWSGRDQFGADSFDRSFADFKGAIEVFKSRHQLEMSKDQTAVLDEVVGDIRRRYRRNAAFTQNLDTILELFETVGQRKSHGSPQARQHMSVAEIYQFDRVQELDPIAADKLRANLEPFLGLVQRLLHDQRYPASTIDRIEYEFGHLRSELYEKPGEPLGSIVHGYFASLLEATIPLLDVAKLEAAAEAANTDSENIRRLVDTGLDRGASPSDPAPFIKTADATQSNAPDEVTTPENRAHWAVRMIAAMTGGVALGAAGAEGAANLDLSWLPPEWAAVVSAVIGIAGALATFRTKASDDK